MGGRLLVGLFDLGEEGGLNHDVVHLILFKVSGHVLSLRLRRRRNMMIYTILIVHLTISLPQMNIRRQSRDTVAPLVGRFLV